MLRQETRVPLNKYIQKRWIVFDERLPDNDQNEELQKEDLDIFLLQVYYSLRCERQILLLHNLQRQSHRVLLCLLQPLVCCVIPESPVALQMRRRHPYQYGLFFDIPVASTLTTL